MHTQGPNRKLETVALHFLIPLQRSSPGTREGGKNGVTYPCQKQSTASSVHPSLCKVTKDTDGGRTKGSNEQARPEAETRRAPEKVRKTSHSDHTVFLHTHWSFLSCCADLAQAALHLSTAESPSSAPWISNMGVAVAPRSHQILVLSWCTVAARLSLSRKQMLQPD